MKQVAIYSKGGSIIPSSNFRILQYTGRLNCTPLLRPMASDRLFRMHNAVHGKWYRYFVYLIYYLILQMKLTGYLLRDIISPPDCIIVVRAASPKVITLLNRILMKKCFGQAKKLIWDFDDNIFKIGEITGFEAGILRKKAETIVVTGDILKNLLSEEEKSRTIILPTTDIAFDEYDVSADIEGRRESFDSRIDILWLASDVSLPNLYASGRQLDKAASDIRERYGKKTVLRVVCNKPFVFETECLEIENIVWSKETAEKELLRAHIGIMPLEDNEFNAGKGGFKIIQYMSAGVPSAASDVGINGNMIENGVTGYLVDNNDPEGWSKALCALAGDRESYFCACKASRKRWEEKFSARRNIDVWNRLVGD